MIIVGRAAPGIQKGNGMIEVEPLGSRVGDLYVSW